MAPIWKTLYHSVILVWKCHCFHACSSPSLQYLRLFLTFIYQCWQSHRPESLTATESLLTAHGRCFSVSSGAANTCKCPSDCSLRCKLSCKAVISCICSSEQQKLLSGNLSTNTRIYWRSHRSSLLTALEEMQTRASEADVVHSFGLSIFTTSLCSKLREQHLPGPPYKAAAAGSRDLRRLRAAFTSSDR